jgi:hypothetical protein
MPKRDGRVIAVPGSATTGAAVSVSDLDNCEIQFNPGSSADYTVQFEGSLDNSNWFPIGSAQVDGTSNVIIDVSAFCLNYVRAHVTEWTASSGQSAAISGFLDEVGA